MEGLFCKNAIVTGARKGIGKTIDKDIIGRRAECMRSK